MVTMQIQEIRTIQYRILVTSFKKARISFELFFVVLGSVMASVLAIGPKVRGFKSDQGLWIFKGDKNSQHDFLRRGSKVVGPISLDFTWRIFCKMNRNVDMYVFFALNSF
jgi:hypothetical protein